MQVRFATNKQIKQNLISNIMLKLRIRAGSQVAERIKTYDLRNAENIRKFSNLDANLAQYPVSIPETNLWK